MLVFRKVRREIVREEEAVFRGADLRGTEAGRGRSTGRRAYPQSGDQLTDVLPVGEPVRRARSRSRAADEAVAGGECAFEATGGRTWPGQDDVARRAANKEVKPARRPLVDHRIPTVLFCDNGSEFRRQAMDLWAYQNGVKIDFSRLGTMPLWSPSTECCEPSV
jgi:transposase InsO family protein